MIGGLVAAYFPACLCKSFATATSCQSETKKILPAVEHLGPLYNIPFQIWILPKSGRRNQHPDLGNFFWPISWYVGGLLPKSGCRFLHCDLSNRHVVAWD